MATYYDRLNAFYKAQEVKALPPGTQLVMLYLLHENNKRGNVDKFYCTDALLIERTGLNKDNITQAKRRLKNKGFIDFQTDAANPRQGTLYILKDVPEVQKPVNYKVGGSPNGKAQHFAPKPWE